MKKSLEPKTVVYPTPAFVIATYDGAGRPNGMTAAWAGICCSSPPCVAVSLRPSRYTYTSAIKRGAFTLNVASEAHVREVDYFGLVSGRDEAKFARTGLTAVRSDLVDAPYVAEFPLALECRLLQTIELGIHVQLIGEIVGIKADESVVDESGKLSIERIRPLLFAPDDGAYYGIGARLAEAFSVGKEIK